MMPKKKHNETAAEQAARFRTEAERMVAAGELNPTAGEKGIETILAGERHEARQSKEATRD